MYLGQSNVNLNGMEINLNGNDSVGLNLDRSNISGNAVFNVNGERIVLLNLNSAIPVNSYVNYDGFTVNSTANSSYVGGNITNAGFYTNGTNVINNKGTLAMGKNSVILLDSATNIIAGNDSVVGMADGIYNGVMPFNFTGTGAVASAFTDKKIITNDLLYSNYIASLAWFSAEEYSEDKIKKIIREFNRIESKENN